MSVHYQVSSKKLHTKVGEKEFFFARAISQGVTTLDQLQKNVARISAISEGDVRSVLYTLTTLISDELAAGRSVELGDLGRMRTGLRSMSAEKKEDFRAQNIKRINVIFRPGKLITARLSSTNVERVAKCAEGGACAVELEPNKKKKEENNPKKKPGVVEVSGL